MVDYTKIKELIFKLLKEKYPESFTHYEAKYGDIAICWSSANYANTHYMPFVSNKSLCTPIISFYKKGFRDTLNIPLTNKEFLELQLILEEVYPAWCQWRVDDVEKSLTNLVSPSDFDQAQEQVLND